MVVNDNAGYLTLRGALGFIASKLAPTGDVCVLSTVYQVLIANGQITTFRMNRAATSPSLR